MDTTPSNPPVYGSTEKWTEIEHLPEWDEEFYHVYTAKKFGKWLMLKTLRPELKGVPEYEQMIEKEFEVRYNLAHPHIIMINDFEEVPGLGMCIITDDVYGDSLEKLIREGKVTEAHLDKLQHQLLDALDYIQANHLEHHPSPHPGLFSPRTSATSSSLMSASTRRPTSRPRMRARTSGTTE